MSVVVRAYMIRDAKGKPPRYGVPMRARQTDDRGVYRIYGLAPGTYIVSAGGQRVPPAGIRSIQYGGDAPTYAPSSPRDAATEVSVQQRRRGGERRHSLSRRAGPHGERNCEFRGRERINRAASILSLASIRPRRITSQLRTSSSRRMARGFAFSGVADGEYDIAAQQYVGTEWVDHSEPRRIQVRGADVTGLELIVKPLASIAGSLVLEESKLPECAGKRRPLVSETVIGPWHNEKDGE